MSADLPVARLALSASIEDIEALSMSDDRGLTISECESMMLVLHELRRLQALEAQAVEIVTRAAVEPPESFEAWAVQEGLIRESHGLRSINSMCVVAQNAWSAARAVDRPVITALQKALAYWMPSVFNERSAHDAYLLVGYDGPSEPSFHATAVGAAERAMLKVLCAGGDYGDDLSDLELRRCLENARDGLLPLVGKVPIPAGKKKPGPSCDPADICAGCRCSHNKYR